MYVLVNISSQSQDSVVCVWKYFPLLGSLNTLYSKHVGFPHQEILRDKLGGLLFNSILTLSAWRWLQIP